jgi:heme-degrading monooxygenase HmoA
MPLYVLVWEFHLKPERETDFERHYGDQGTWCRLFQTGIGYKGTKLLKDSQQSNRYITMDYWSSKEHYEQFLKEKQEEYASMDRQCESLTDAESFIGSFHTIGSFNE